MTCGNVGRSASGLGKHHSVVLQCSRGFPTSCVLDPFRRAGARGRAILQTSVRVAPGVAWELRGGVLPSHRPYRRVVIMTSSDTPPVPRRLPSGVHEAVRPGSALLRLETTESRKGALDGAWWPRSRDIGAELPALLSALVAHLGPVSRVGLDAAAWEGLPTRIVVDDHVVHIDSFPVGDDTVLITRGDRDHFSLLVVPPDTPPEAARAAMAQAVLAGNVSEGEQILIDTGTGHRPSG